MVNGLEIFEHSGEGYMPNMHFESWRVATMNYSPKNDEANLTYLERHMKTDEVFVLMHGECTLIIGKDMVRVPMKKYKIYNVKKGVWHTNFVSRDAKVLIVENEDTGEENSEYFYFDK